MKLNIKRYSVMLTVQTILFLIDISINTFSTLVRQHNGASLILFIVQTACLILSLGSLFLTFFSTYAFQAGLIDLLYAEFHLSLVIFFLYFVTTILLQVWFLVVQWNNSLKFYWSTPMFVFFILQRTLTPIYYYHYKKACLRISDPRFYEDVWIQTRLQTQ